jgi:phage host-nuclease inhibitor protein Gam
MGQAADAALIFKQKTDVLLEKQLSYLPLPKKEDMDSLYKTVNDLRREVRTLKREVKALKKGQEAEAAPKIGPAKKAPVKKAPAKKPPVKEAEKGD